MGELEKSREWRVATEPIELEEVSIVEELEPGRAVVSATPKKQVRRAIGTTPPAATNVTPAGDDWLDRLDL